MNVILKYYTLLGWIEILVQSFLEVNKKKKTPGYNKTGTNCLEVARPSMRQRLQRILPSVFRAQRRIQAHELASSKETQIFYSLCLEAATEE